MLQVGMGRGSWRGRGRRRMKMSEMVDWSACVTVSRGSAFVHASMYVLVLQPHACMHASGWRTLLL